VMRGGGAVFGSLGALAIYPGFYFCNYASIWYRNLCVVFCGAITTGYENQLRIVAVLGARRSDFTVDTPQLRFARPLVSATMRTKDRSRLCTNNVRISKPYLNMNEQCIIMMIQQTNQTRGISICNPNPNPIHKTPHRSLCPTQSDNKYPPLRFPKLSLHD
jgi:hypothetical protein